jgi:hypothetical protein
MRLLFQESKSAVSFFLSPQSRLQTADAALSELPHCRLSAAHLL